MLRLRSPRGQHGQVAVLFALGSMGLVGMVGLVLMAGLLFWDQRQLQTLADGAALAGAVQVPQSCTSSTPVSVADTFVANQLGASSNLNLAGWSCGAPVTDTLSNGYSAVYTYPWNNKAYEIAVKITRSGIPLQFGAFLGASQATISGRAVAQHTYAHLPKSFALYGQNGIACSGSNQGNSNPKLDVNGSIYAGQSVLSGNGSSSPQSIIMNGYCGPWANDTVAFDGTEDYGDILAYDDNQVWINGGKCLGGSPGAAACADGFEVSGHGSTNCGITGTTEYLKDSTTTVADPCAGIPPPVPLLSEANYAGTEPNADQYITDTIGGPCSLSGAQTGRSVDYSTASGNKTYYWGYGPSPQPTVSSTTTFSPGCYGYLDVGTFLSLNTSVKEVVLAPGFYYFNGNDCNLDGSSGCSATSGGGLCLTGTNTELHGTDVTMEFVNSSWFSTASCGSNPLGSCGSKVACDFGTSTLPPGDNGEKFTLKTSSGGQLPIGTYDFHVTYTNSFGETLADSTNGDQSWSNNTANGELTMTVTGAPFEATGMNVYLYSCSGATFLLGCSAGGVTPGKITCQSVSTCVFSTTDQGGGDDWVEPTTNTATDWLAAPPTSPEDTPSCSAPTVGCPSLTDLASGSSVISNLPAGTYGIEETYADPEGETPPLSPAVSLTINAGDQLEITTPSAPQGVTVVKFYLTSAPAGVTTGYLGEVAAPVRSPVSYVLTSKTQATTGVNPPAAGQNGTSSSWCTAGKFEAEGAPSTTVAKDVAICANRLVWAPPGPSPSEIAGDFYVKGSNENSALMGDIYWPGPANSSPNGNSAGCNYDANGVGGMIGQVICDSLVVQGGSQAGTATIGYTTGAEYSLAPEISLVE